MRKKGTNDCDGSKFRNSEGTYLMPFLDMDRTEVGG